MTKTRILDFVVWIITMVLLIVLLYQLINRILGHSWQVEAFVVALMTLVLTATLFNSSKISRLEGEFGHFKRSFGALAHDFKEFRKEQHEFNNWARNQFREINYKLDAK